MAPDSAVAPFLDVRGLHAGYGRTAVLNGVDLRLDRGEFASLLGPNGAGKSTLLRTLFGMTTVHSGTMRYDGADLVRATSGEILRRGVSYVPQGRCNFPLMTIEENLDLAAYHRRDKDAVAADTAAAYERFPLLKEHRRRLASHLSGGQQQILELAMAFLRRPALLLIDEPSMGLAPQAIALVFDELARLRRDGLTILLVEQNTAKAMEVSGRVVVMRLGRIVWDGARTDIDHRQLGELFLARKTAESTQ
ncbi:MAG: ABC transporter ATP-binding protein [Burkholderiales bacterium]